MENTRSAGYVPCKYKHSEGYKSKVKVLHAIHSPVINTFNNLVSFQTLANKYMINTNRAFKTVLTYSMKESIYLFESVYLE